MILTGGAKFGGGPDGGGGILPHLLAAAGAGGIAAGPHRDCLLLSSVLIPVDCLDVDMVMALPVLPWRFCGVFAPDDECI